MSLYPCISGCGHFLTPSNGHNRCLSWLNGLCPHCESMTMAMLRSRLSLFMVGERTFSATQRGPSALHRAVLVSTQGNLRVTVGALLPDQFSWIFPLLNVVCRRKPSLHGGPSISMTRSQLQHQCPPSIRPRLNFLILGWLQSQSPILS